MFRQALEKTCRWPASRVLPATHWQHGHRQEAQAHLPSGELCAKAGRLTTLLLFHCPVSYPQAKIKKLMQTDDDVGRIATGVPPIICESTASTAPLCANRRAPEIKESKTLLLLLFPLLSLRVVPCSPICCAG